MFLQAEEERNYHIFYQLCASSSLPEFKDFALCKWPSEHDDGLVTSRMMVYTVWWQKCHKYVLKMWSSWHEMIIFLWDTMQLVCQIIVMIK